LVPTPSDPSDPNWPKVPSVAYPNDPTDPTQPGQVTVPTVPGYTPHDGDGNPLTPGSTITPTNPGQDTSITYTANDEQATVTYIDDTTGKTLGSVDTLTGKFATTDSYRTSTRIKDYEAEGYQLVSDNYPVNGVIYNEDGTVQNFVVHLTHGTTPITPSNPGTPGQPIDPSNPTGPKWPNDTDKNSLDVINHENVHYVMSDGTKAPADQTDQVEFTRTGTVDNVTGEVTYTDWVAKDGDTTFGIKTTP
ncbi:mucin-binding protein, partial [Furfurilactobacillus sp. WILCCON 0119]